MKIKRKTSGIIILHDYYLPIDINIGSNIIHPTSHNKPKVQKINKVEEPFFLHQNKKHPIKVRPYTITSL